MEQMQKNRKRPVSGIWVMIVAVVLLPTILCVQYFTSRKAIHDEAVDRACTELKRAELKIETHTAELEAAAKTLAMLAEKNVDCPDSISAATRSVVRILKEPTSIAVAYVPDYFPPKGRYFEICSSRITKDSVYTRQIGSAEHDYTRMEWFQNGLTIDSCWWCEPYLDDSGSGTFVVSCSYPVRNKQGEKVASVCIDWTLDGLHALSNSLEYYDKSNCSIYSSRGDTIVGPDTIAGRKYIFFDEEVEATGWHIQLRIPEDVLFSKLRETSLWISIMMLVGLAVLALILTYSARTTRKMIDFAEKNQRIEGELEVAQTIQMAMLPKVFPPFLDRLDLNVYGIVDPAKEIGGDLYDFYVRHDKLFFCVGDVSGKGVPAALVMATARSLFRTVTSREENAANIVAEMNDTLSDQNEQNMFLTLFLGVLDLQTGQLDYCNAGHNAPVIMTKGEWRMVDVLPNLPLGVEKGFVFRAQTTEMHYNDVLFLYTDGLTEAENKNHDQYGEARMMDKLRTCASLHPRELVEDMQSSVVGFVDGAQQSDDLTMLCIRYQTSAIVMRNDIQQIPTLSEWIEGLGVPAALNMPINLALEEAVSNVMLYAYPDKQNEQVFVEFVRGRDEQGENIIFTISDSGIPFDPTQQAEADITLSAEERAIGGLGIHLVRQLMDEVRYKREDNKNILTLIKHI